jgi:hypothetical protein
MDPDQKPQRLLSAHQRIKRSIQEYEQSILQQQAVAGEELLADLEPAVTHNSKQVLWICTAASWGLGYFQSQRV